MNNFLKQTVNKAKEEAIKTARQMVHEPVEIFKETKSQAGLPKEVHPQSGMSMMQEVMTGGGAVKELSPAEEMSINAATMSRLQQIEAELRQLRQDREQKGIDYLKEQNSLMKGSSGQENKPQFTEAQGKKNRSKGKQGQKKGNMEVGKQNKG